MPSIEYVILHRALCRKADRIVTAVSHQKKLKAITKICVLPFESKDAVTNACSDISAQDEGEAPKFSLSHSIVPSYINKTDIFAFFEYPFSL